MQAVIQRGRLHGSISGGSQITLGVEQASAAS